MSIFSITGNQKPHIKKLDGVNSTVPGIRGSKHFLRKEGSSPACFGGNRAKSRRNQGGEILAWEAKSVSFPDSGSLSGTPRALCPSLASLQPASCQPPAPDGGKCIPTGAPDSLQCRPSSPSSSRAEFQGHSVATTSPSRPLRPACLKKA